MSERTILHVDMDAFFAAVEQHDHPELRGKPVVVGAPPDKRGVVSAASYEAREYGIHSAMPSREAGRRCPHAAFRPVNGKRYADVSRQIFAIFHRFTPLVEGLSIDEAFLDVTGARRLFGTGRQIAETIRQTIRAETGLTASVGLAHNKFLAKLASDMDKPDGLTVVPRDPAQLLAFLAPLPVSRLWGVGKVTGRVLTEAGIRTVGQLHELSEQRLAPLLGARGARHLLALAHGRDARDVTVEREEKSISREHTFGTDCRDANRVRQVLVDLVEDVGTRLRAAGRFARVAHMKLRWKGFETITRQRPLRPPCHDDFALRETAVGLFEAEPLVKPVRLVGFGVSGFTDRFTEQLSLFAGDTRRSMRRETLSHTVDAIRERHGKTSIQRGSARRGRD